MLIYILLLFLIIYLFVVHKRNKNIKGKLFKEKFKNQNKDDLVGSIIVNNLNVKSILDHVKIESEFLDNFNWATDNNYYRKPCLRDTIFDQGDCGCCYAIAIVSAIESCYYRYNLIQENKPFIKFSLQQIIDCTSANPPTYTKPNKGCEGGFENLTIKNVFGFPTKFCTEDQYPFTSNNDNSFTYNYKSECPQSTYCGDNSVKINSIHLPALSLVSLDVTEDYLKKALYYYGPLIVDLNFELIRDYKKGEIFRDIYKLQPDADHGLILTGWKYTVEGEGISKQTRKYWIIKNSHGNDWGNDGYLWITMAKQQTKSSPISRNSFALVINRPGCNTSFSIINPEKITYTENSSITKIIIISYISDKNLTKTLKIIGDNLVNIPFLDSENNIIDPVTKKSVLVDINNYYCNNPLINKSQSCSEKNWFYYELDINLPVIITDTIWNFDFKIYNTDSSILTDTLTNIYWFAKIIINKIDKLNNQISLNIPNDILLEKNGYSISIQLYRDNTIFIDDITEFIEPLENDDDIKYIPARNYNIVVNGINSGTYMFYYIFESIESYRYRLSNISVI